MRVIGVPRLMSMKRLIRLLADGRFDEVILDVPRGALACRDRLDLELLALFARDKGLSILIHTPDGRLRASAAAAGLGIAEALPAAEDPAELLAAAREEPAARLPHPPAWFMACMFLSVLAGALFVLWPRPTVAVSAARRNLALSAEAEVSPAYRESQIPAGRLPARSLAKSDLIVVEIAASGAKITGVTPARGRVILLNETPNRVAVPAGTIIEGKGGVRYRVASAVTVPEAKAGFLLGVRVSTSSGQTEAEIVAEEPGTMGNLGPGTVRTIVGPLGRVLKAVNPAALTGGTDRRVAVVTAADVERGRLEALRQLHLGALDGLRSQAGEGEILLEELLDVKEGTVRAEPSVDAVSETVRVNLPYTVRCLCLSRTTLAKFLQERARRLVPPFFTLTHEPFDVKELKAVPRENGGGRLRISANFVAVGRPTRERLFAALRGRTAEEARTAVLRLPEVEAVRMDLPPGGRLPRYAWQIRLVLPADER